MRRVRDLNRKAAEGQDELFTCWRYHAIFTDSPFQMIEAEAQHRDYAIAGQVFADLTSGPSGGVTILKFGVSAVQMGLPGGFWCATGVGHRPPAALSALLPA